MASVNNQMGDLVDMGAPPAEAARRRAVILVVAIAAVIFGALGACAAGSMLLPDLRAARGYGVVGTLTLTEPNGCDRYQPPKQRCGWFGDFHSGDGKVVKWDVELDGGLPPGAQVGDTIAARDAGDPNGVYRVDDHQTWRLSAVILAGFSAAFLVGLVLLQPWTWRERLRQRR
jgi:hypothetical protein